MLLEAFKQANEFGDCQPVVIAKEDMDEERQTLDTLIAKLSKEKKSHNGVSKKTRILLVSETNNACLSLSSSDEENEGGGEPDLHQCGHCKQMFYNFTKYITHKLQKVCWDTDATPTEDVAPWSIERNGSSSPEDQPKDRMEEGEHQQANVEIKNLHQELQKRKHRKGIVRRIKPNETDDTNVEGTESLVYVPADEETVYIQAENTEEAGAHDSDGTDNKELIQRDIMKLQSNNILGKSPSTGKYGVSLYSYSKSKKPGQKMSDISQPYGGGQSGSSPHSAMQQSSIYNKRRYNQSPNKQFSDQGPYPGFYPEKGNQRSEGIDSYTSYGKNKYSYDTPAHHRTSNATVTYARSSDRYNKGTYSPYDHYRTMANLAPESRQPRANKTSPKKDIVDNIKNNEQQRTGNEDDNTLQNADIKTLDDLDPPELVRISPSSDDQIELTSTINKSPPALEKCESSNADGDLLKVEEEESRDSINDPEDLKHPEDTPSEGAVQSPTAVKFMNMPSPDKESNSPLGSTTSHETEDFNQESKDSPEIRLPRHRKLSEATVERLITEPSSQADASWKHAKQVYRCPLCAKIFPFKSKLQRHVLVHTGIKPYKCTVCSRGFTQQIDLQRHLTRHTGEKPFKCHLCKAQFIRADNLRKHCKDAHYVNIEEPIRKRRRKTTGSDTVLPPLEVAIAMALSETERNGGRVLGRCATRSNTRSTTTTTTKQQSRFPAESGFSQPARSEEPSSSTSYSTRVPSHSESRSSYPPSYPPHLGPRVRYPFQHTPESRQGYSMSRRPRSPDYHPNSPSYHREGRYAHPGEPSVRYYQTSSAPPPRGYYVRPGYEREGEPFYIEKDEHGMAPGPPQPPTHGFQVQEYRSMALEQTSPSFMGKRPIRGDDEMKYMESRGGARKHLEEEYPGEMQPEDPRFRNSQVDARYGGSSSSTSTKHASAEYIQPRPGVAGEGEEEAHGGALHYGQPRSEDDHRTLFRGKQSISYGDYGAAASRNTPDDYERPSSRAASEKSSPSSSQQKHSQDYLLFQKSSADPGEFVTMATERGGELNLDEAHPLSITPPPGVVDAQGNVYVDEQETPIVRPSDDPSVEPFPSGS